MTASTLSQGYRHTARLFIYENSYIAACRSPSFSYGLQPMSAAPTKRHWRNRHGLQTDDSHGRRFERWQKLGFAIWRCGCNPDRSAYSCRRCGQKRGTEYNGVEHRVAGNQRFAEPLNYQPPRPISLNAVFVFEVAVMPTWWSGHAANEPRLRQAHMDSVYSFSLKVALVAAMFLLALLIAYLAH